MSHNISHICMTEIWPTKDKAFISLSVLKGWDAAWTSETMCLECLKSSRAQRSVECSTGRCGVFVGKRAQSVSISEYLSVWWRCRCRDLLFRLQARIRTRGDEVVVQDTWRCHKHTVNIQFIHTSGAIYVETQYPWGIYSRTLPPTSLIESFAYTQIHYFYP